MITLSNLSRNDIHAVGKRLSEQNNAAIQSGAGKTKLGNGAYGAAYLRSCGTKVVKVSPGDMGYMNYVDIIEDELEGHPNVPVVYARHVAKAGAMIVVLEKLDKLGDHSAVSHDWYEFKNAYNYSSFNGDTELYTEELYDLLQQIMDPRDSFGIETSVDMHDGNVMVRCDERGKPIALVITDPWAGGHNTDMAMYMQAEREAKMNWFKNDCDFAQCNTIRGCPTGGGCRACPHNGQHSCSNTERWDFVGVHKAIWIKESGEDRNCGKLVIRNNHGSVSRARCLRPFRGHHGATPAPCTDDWVNPVPASPPERITPYNTPNPQGYSSPCVKAEELGRTHCRHRGMFDCRECSCATANQPAVTIVTSAPSSSPSPRGWAMIHDDPIQKAILEKRKMLMHAALMPAPPYQPRRVVFADKLLQTYFNFRGE